VNIIILVLTRENGVVSQYSLILFFLGGELDTQNSN
jgi:hypothetical protein